MTQPTDFFVEPYRQSLQSTVDAVNLILSGVSRLQELQLKAINEITAATADTSRQILEARDMPGLMELQQSLARSYFEKAAGCWTGLCEAAGRNNMDAVKRVQERIAQAGDEWRKVAANASPDAAPGMAAFQSMMDAARQVYAVTTKAAEDFTRATATAARADSGAAQRAQAAKAPAQSRPAA